jgi:hypothetical protein
MIFINVSENISIDASYNHLQRPCHVHLFLQYFIHDNHVRRQEFKECLRRNITNPHITHIHLLNEKMIPMDDYGANNHKIHQSIVPGGKRLLYKDVFTNVRENNWTGYFIIANADIFFDDTLQKIHTSCLHKDRTVLALLRYEFRKGITVDQAPLFGPRTDSQDTWVIHSNHIPTQHQSDHVLNFPLGKPGCDNKMIYLLRILGYNVVNDPRFLRTYHYHTNLSREYTIKDSISKPWGVIVPAGANPIEMPNTLGIDMKRVCSTTKGLSNMKYEDNDVMREYIYGKIILGENFIVPRVSGIENNFAVFGRICKIQGNIPENILQYFKKVGGAMKNNAGIHLSSMNSILSYSDQYLKAFENCEIFAGWECWGSYLPHIADSYEIITNQIYPSKPIIWSFAMDIFHYIYREPWTWALRGKRILIVSCFEESIRQQIPKRTLLYDGVDLFPECTFTTIKPPITNAGNPSRDFDEELRDFYTRLDKLTDVYDVALVSAGGYSTLICNHIFEKGKSSVQVSGVLQMYFGILGQRWIKERPDIVKLFVNEHWTRPKEHEKPLNYNAVEGGCYW